MDVVEILPFWFLTFAGVHVVRLGLVQVIGNHL